MSDTGLHIRCQRCGTEMDMRDPGPGQPWTPDQFWVCPKCGRHFWSTYPQPKTPAAPKPGAAEPKAVAAAGS
jgi:ribosomal protein L37E